VLPAATVDHEVHRHTRLEAGAALTEWAFEAGQRTEDCVRQAGEAGDQAGDAAPATVSVYFALSTAPAVHSREAYAVERAEPHPLVTSVALESCLSALVGDTLMLPEGTAALLGKRLPRTFAITLP